MCKYNNCWIKTYNTSICIVATKTLSELLPQTGGGSGGGGPKWEGGGRPGGTPKLHLEGKECERKCRTF